LRIDAATSLREVVNELCELHAQRTGGPLPLVNLAGSGELAQQIAAAQKSDLFLSAGDREMDRLAELGLVRDETRRRLCSNALVIVARDAQPAFRVEQLAESGALSVAHPELVPAGRYAADWLREVELWNAVEARLTRSTNARAALAAVQSGATKYGIVYASDAASAPELHVVYSIDADATKPIVYPGAVLTCATAPIEARAFLDLCTSSEGRAIFARHAFLVGRDESAAEDE